jgi:transcriptional regulator with XRE-family HTH domain
MSFPDRLKKARGATSQKEFSEMVGVHNSTFSRWERGEQYPSQPDICKILQIRPLISPAWLVTGEGPMERSADPPPSKSDSPIKLSILKDVIEAVEEHLDDRDLELVPDKKAELISILYEMVIEKDEQKVDKAAVLRLVKLAA